MDNPADLEFMKRLLVLLADCQALIAEHCPDTFEGYEEGYEDEYERVQAELELVLSIQGKR